MMLVRLLITPFDIERDASRQWSVEKLVHSHLSEVIHKLEHLSTYLSTFLTWSHKKGILTQLESSHRANRGGEDAV